MEQQKVINAGPGARLLVDAAPGHGKTAVGCARIARLINECGIEAVNILLVSFTRTAVAELRNRIAAIVGNPARAAGIRIATLDSTTWTLLNGFDSTAASLFGGFDANIERLCDQFRQRNDDLLEHMSKYEHIVVDEAQDILGPRARLVDLLLAHTSPSCGVTVLTDPCQAIYGFTSENGDAASGDASSLVQRLESGGNFEKVELGTLHRTSQPSLMTLLSHMRPIVVAAVQGNRHVHILLREKIKHTATTLATTRETLAETVKNRDDLLILYRTRAEALLSASMLCSSGVRHKLRISGLPSWLQPWIGAIFRDYTQPQIDRPTFERLWHSRNCANLIGSPPFEEAWQNCLRVAGQAGRVKLDVLRRVLSRSRPPVEFCVVDSGTSGPTVGTIHASKGREADNVFLYLPQERKGEGEGIPWDEESRVLYVGATRAKKSIYVATGGPTYSMILPTSGRPVRPYRKEIAAQFEVGRDGDLDLASIVAPAVHSVEEAGKLQEWLASTTERFVEFTAQSDPSWNWRYRLQCMEDGAPTVIGDLSEGFSGELLEVARMLKAKRPGQIPHIWQVGVRTVVVSSDSPLITSMVVPFNRTGFFLAPVLRAWTKSRFRKGFKP